MSPSGASRRTGNTNSLSAKTSFSRARRSWSGRPVRSRRILVQQVKRHEQRRRGDGVRIGLAPPIEARAELLIVDRHLTVEHERAGGQLPDGGGEISEPARVVAAVAADEVDALAVLV